MCLCVCVYAFLFFLFLSRTRTLNTIKNVSNFNIKTFSYESKLSEIPVNYIRRCQRATVPWPIISELCLPVRAASTNFNEERRNFRRNRPKTGAEDPKNSLDRLDRVISRQVNLCSLTDAIFSLQVRATAGRRNCPRVNNRSGTALSRRTRVRETRLEFGSWARGAGGGTKDSQPRRDSATWRIGESDKSEDGCREDYPLRGSVNNSRAKAPPNWPIEYIRREKSFVSVPKKNSRVAFPITRFKVNLA